MGRINTGGAKKRTGDNIALASSVSGTTLKLNPPKGYYDGVTGTVNITDADFVASKILTGTNLFGLNGNLEARKYARITSGTWTNGQVVFSCAFKPLMGVGSAHRITSNYYGLFFFLDSTLDKLDARLYDGTIYGIGTAQTNFNVGVTISDLGGGSYRISGLSANFAATDTDQMILHVFG